MAGPDILGGPYGLPTPATGRLSLFGVLLGVLAGHVEGVASAHARLLAGEHLDQLPGPLLLFLALAGFAGFDCGPEVLFRYIAVGIHLTRSSRCRKHSRSRRRRGSSPGPRLRAG